MPVHSVLLIDDDPGVLETLSPYFRLAGFDVSTAASGTAAVNLGKSRMFDAIVCDVRLPDISGIEVLTELRRTGVCAPFVMMSGFATVESTARAMKLGAADFLEKPVDGGVLVETVRLLARSTPPSPKLQRATSAGHPGLAGHADQPRVEVGRLSSGNHAVSHDWPDAIFAMLTHRAVCSGPHVWEFLAIADLLRKAVTATSTAERTQIITEAHRALQNGVIPLRETKDERVIAALAVLGDLEGRGLHLTEANLGRVMGVSGSYAGRLLRKSTGVDFRTLRRAHRMMHAVQWLANSEEHVRQVAYRSGFNDATQFDHEFRRLFGMAPTAFRACLGRIGWRRQGCDCRPD